MYLELHDNVTFYDWSLNGNAISSLLGSAPRRGIWITGSDLLYDFDEETVEEETDCDGAVIDEVYDNPTHE